MTRLNRTCIYLFAARYSSSLNAPVRAITPLLSSSASSSSSSSEETLLAPQKSTAANNTVDNEFMNTIFNNQSGIKQLASKSVPKLVKFFNFDSAPLSVSWNDMIQRAANEVLERESVQDLESLLPEEWRDFFERLERAGLKRSKLTASVLHCLFEDAAERSSVDLGERLLRLAGDQKIDLTRAVGGNVAQLCRKLDERGVPDATRIMNAYLDALRKLDVYVSKPIAESIKDWFCSLTSQKWTANYVHIDHSGQCPNCLQPLEAINLSIDDVKKLKSTILTDIVNSDTFFQKFPQAINDAINFFGSSSYHYVLNFDQTTLDHRQLKYFITDLNEKHKKDVMIVSKKLKINPKDMDIRWLRCQVDSVLVPETSLTDHYMLIAAMFRNDHAEFITEGNFKLISNWLFGKSYASLFRIWFLKHRALFDYNKQLMEWNRIPPSNYAPVAQRTDTCIHLPCSSKNIAPVELNFPDYWLCLKTHQLLQ